MKNALKILKTASDYDAALARFEKLLDAEKGSDAYEERDVLAVLIERYEDAHFSVDPPDPIEAIRFRMEQAGLSRKDLEPLLGGKSKVSEVLSGKRDLTLAMIRALNTHLHIPAEVLVHGRLESLPAAIADLDFSHFPLREMEENGAFEGFRSGPIGDHAEEAVRWLVQNAGGFQAIPAAGFKKNDGMRLNAKMDRYALFGWSLQVLRTAVEDTAPVRYSPASITREYVKALVTMSVLDDGPRHARTYLAQNGITLVAVPHLKHTYLDGAVFMPGSGRPVIGLSLRYDRLDNFWFVLLHEIGHLALGHLSKERNWIADDLDLPRKASGEESDADEYAAQALLPAGFDLHRNDRLSAADIRRYAADHTVHPAIVAGRIQHERGDYRTFANLVGRGEVRVHFPTYGKRRS